MTVGKPRAVDLFRRNRALERKYAQIGRDLVAVGEGIARDFGSQDTSITSTTTCCGSCSPPATLI